MSENPEGTLSFEQAAEAIVEPQATPEAEDAQPAETEEVEATAEEETEVEAAEEEGQAEAEAEDEADAEEDPLVTVTINGKEEEVPFSEALKGYSRQQDYTRKSMELADQRREFQSEMEQSREAIRSQKAQLEDALTHFAIPTQQEPNWAELAQTMDPREFNAARAQWEAHSRQQQQAREALAQFKQKERDELMQAEKAQLLTHFPEWSDATVFQTAAAEMVKFGADYGFSAGDLDQVADHRMFRVLQDAIAYRKQKAEADAAVKKVAKAPKKMPAGKPTGKNQRAQQQRQENMDRLKKTGSMDAAINALMS